MKKIQIEQITLTDVRAGKVWRLVPPLDGFDWSQPLEKLGLVEEAVDLRAEDYVLYSAVGVPVDGRVVPLLVLKVLGEYDYGGDVLEHTEGRWCQMKPNPGNPFSESFIANPNPKDPSFDAFDHDERKRQHEGFQRYAAKIKA